MQKDVIFTEDEHSLTARLRRDVDHHTAKSMREKIHDRMIDCRPAVLVIDLSEVEFMDSSGIGLILGRVEKATTLGAEVLVTGASSRLMRLIRLSGIDRVRHLSVIG